MINASLNFYFNSNMLKSFIKNKTMNYKGKRKDKKY